jgi:hypothetical protein
MPSSLSPRKKSIISFCVATGSISFPEKATALHPVTQAPHLTQSFISLLSESL